MTTLLAYHGDPAIKARYLARVKAHRKADELVQGIGWETNGQTRGCAVGCTLDAYDHARYPVELGVPIELAYLEDAIFEGLPVKGAQKWPERFLSAIQPGSDLSMVWPRWALWMLADPEHGVIRYAGDRADVRAAIDGVAALYREWVSAGVRPTTHAAWAAKAAAKAARDAAGVARDAAWAAAGDAAGDAARDVAFVRMADRLILELERATKDRKENA